MISPTKTIMKMIATTRSTVEKDRDCVEPTTERLMFPAMTIH
jgi:hypothetical protein